MAYTKQDQFYFLSYAEQRAARLIYRKYKVNRFELVLLCGIFTFLQLNGKRTVGRGPLFEWLGCSSSVKYKSHGYLHGLIKRGAVHNLAYKKQLSRGGSSYAISAFGWMVIDEYYQEVERIDRITRDRKTKPSGKAIVVHSTEDIPGYILISAGRDV
jgi:hypothetical protein